jgi:hypothetical protein
MYVYVLCVCVYVSSEAGFRVPRRSGMYVYTQTYMHVLDVCTHAHMYVQMCPYVSVNVCECINVCTWTQLTALAGKNSATQSPNHASHAHNLQLHNMTRIVVIQTHITYTQFAALAVMDSAGNSMTITSPRPAKTAPVPAEGPSHPKVLVMESLHNTQADLAGEKQGDLREMTVVELQTKCREKGVSGNGSKQGTCPCADVYICMQKDHSYTKSRHVPRFEHCVYAHENLVSRR